MIQTSFFPQPKKDEPVKIIQIAPSGLQPRKVEELLPDQDILSDTYIIYPTGGYHPFYSVPNTFPIYQQKIWPCIRRIKFSERYKNQEARDRVRSGSLQREHYTINQINPTWDKDYFYISLYKNGYRIVNNYTVLKKNGEHRKNKARRGLKAPLHRLVALAFIPNPENHPLVMHDNDDTTNYLPENLVWGTPGMNAKGVIRRRPDTMEQKYLNLVDRGIIKG
tara:strand:- start:57 stop:722 length:666 start_codon:yes stop_codon:yes gene_type:complete